MPQSLYALALLACPLGMGLMMWMMMRGSKQEPTSDADIAAQQAELTRMRVEIDQLTAARDHERVAAMGYSSR